MKLRRPCSLALCGLGLSGTLAARTASAPARKVAPGGDWVVYRARAAGSEFVELFATSL